MHVAVPFFMLVVFILARRRKQAFTTSKRQCCTACLFTHLPLVVLHSADFFSCSSWKLHAFYARSLFLLRVTYSWAGIAFIVFMWIVNDLLAKSSCLMAFDHTGVRVTSAPDCGLICGFVKTVTFGFGSPPSHLKAYPAVWSQLLWFCVSRVIFWSSSSCSLLLLLVIFSVLKVWRRETTGAVECMNTVGPHSKPDSRQTPAVARHSCHHAENSWVGKM